MEGTSNRALYALQLCAAVALLFTSSLAAGQATLGSAPSDTLDCDVAVVGGGPGGVYSAYRHATAFCDRGKMPDTELVSLSALALSILSQHSKYIGAYAQSSYSFTSRIYVDSLTLLETNSSLNVCLYEATHRVGGRVYSVRGLGPNGDLVLDMGAYRYMPLAQALITDLIQDLLVLPNRLYQPGVPDYKVILTPDGSNAGFATYVEKLLQLAISLGLQMNYNTEISKMTEMETGGFILTTKDGRNTTAQRVILNLPSRPLHRLLQNSKLPSAEYNDELYNFYQIRATKLYLYYPNAWWIANGLNNGSLSYNLPWNTSAPSVPIIGRYYDAQVKCPLMMNSTNGTVAASSVSSPRTVDYFYQNANSMDTQNCYGYIQATYTSDGGTTNISHFPLDYLVDYASPTTGADGFSLPYSVWDNTTYEGDKLLKDSHSQLMAYHASKNINLPAAVQNSLPTEAVVAFWDAGVTWSGGAWHSNKTVNASEPDFVAEAIKPFGDLEIYVANEAYSTQLGWSEGSLVMAENLLQDYFGATQQWWMHDQTQAIIRYGPGFKDFEDSPQMSFMSLTHFPSHS